MILEKLHTNVCRWFYIIYWNCLLLVLGGHYISISHCRMQFTFSGVTWKWRPLVLVVVLDAFAGTIYFHIVFSLHGIWLFSTVKVLGEASNFYIQMSCHGFSPRNALKNVLNLAYKAWLFQEKKEISLRRNGSLFFPLVQMAHCPISVWAVAQKIPRGTLEDKLMIYSDKSSSP